MSVEKFSTQQLGFPFTFIKGIREKVNEIIETARGILTDKVSATGNLVEINATRGSVTTEVLTNPANIAAFITVNNNKVKAGDIVLSSISYSSASFTVISATLVTTGQIQFEIYNPGSVALNGPATINFIVL